MALSGYDVSPGTMRTVKGKVEGHIDDLPGKRSALSTAVDNSIESCKMPQVASALTGLWNDILALQTEAAETRVKNACTALGDVAQAYENGDQSMMDDAEESIVAVPELDINDGKTV
ncbi:hypothetical protein GCM10022377_08490 [Zhihengliuella alba]|uniref:Excreted virulence factor EspC (Type VII ESX diderm) n=1 Tax=Zhihengliuella alba TaxID=547018 RepID=A0ABP7D0T2_9MICC